MERVIITDDERYKQRQLTFYSFLARKFDLSKDNKFQVVFPHINRRNKFDTSRESRGQEGKFVELPDGSSRLVLGRVHMDTDNVYCLDSKGDVSILYLRALVDLRQSLKKNLETPPPPYIFGFVEIDRMDSVRAYFYSDLFN